MMRPLLVIASFAMVVSLGCASGQLSRAESAGSSGSAELAELRASTHRFQTLDSAVAAGYPREVAQCLVHEHHGAMGYHHVNRANLARNIEVSKPQILLYERMP